MSAEGSAPLNLKEWDDERSRRVRAALINPDRRGEVEPGDVFHTLCVNKGELVLQVENAAILEFIWPTPADAPEENFVASARHTERGAEWTSLLTHEELLTRLDSDWSIVTTDEAGLDRPDEAMGGDA
jgi:hypothetical protein